MVRRARRILAAVLAAQLGSSPLFAANVVRPVVATAPGAQAGVAGAAGASLTASPSLQLSLPQPGLGLSVLPASALTGGLQIAPAVSQQAAAAPSASVARSARTPSAAASANPHQTVGITPSRSAGDDSNSNGSAAVAAGRGQDVAGRSSREGIRETSAALGQDAKAAKNLPGLAALGSDAKAPDAAAAPSSLRAEAEAFFNKKAGLGQAHFELEDEDILFGAEAGFLPGAANARKAPAQGAGLSEPVYPARQIRFRNKIFPSVAFRPDRPVEEHLLDAIDASEKTIDIALYEFKNREVLKALRRAKARGVQVRVLLDFGHSYPAKRDDSDFVPRRSLEIQALVNEGFDVKVIKGIWKYGIAHNKIAVFDGRLGWFGSYNVSYTSERNHFENVVFTTAKSRVGGLQSLFKYLSDHAVDFAAAETHVWPEFLPAPPKYKGKGIPFNGLKLPGYVFTPDESAEQLVVDAIGRADRKVEMSMFTLTSPAVVRALAAAKKRGLEVKVVVDKSQSGESFMKPFIDWLAFQGVEVKTLAGPNPDGPEWAEKNHNKFLILDDRLVFTGSLNYTASGFRTNFENMFILDEKPDVASFDAYFGDLFGHTRAERVVAPIAEPDLPNEADVIDGLRGPPAPLPPRPTWGPLPDRGAVEFNGETFPANAVRPHDPIKDILVKAIDKAEKSIHLALYEFNLPEVMDALRRAKAKTPALDIKIVVDYSHVFPSGMNSRGEERTRSTEIQALIDEGFDIEVLRGVMASGIMHYKMAVFDGKMVEFGSYNWAVTAEENHFESVKFNTDKKRVDFHERVFAWMREQAVPFAEAETHSWNKAWKHRRKAGDQTPMGEADIVFNGEHFPFATVSPQGMVEDTLVRAIRAAKATIDVAMFSFYSARIAEELLLAKQRGVTVRIALDSMQAKQMKLDDWFSYHGFDVRIVAGPNPYGNVMWEKNHNKFMIVDGGLLAFGSYNYTGNAEANSYENVDYFVDELDLAFFNAYFALLHSAGWKAWVPDEPPEGMSSAADFFSEERVKTLSRVLQFDD